MKIIFHIGMGKTGTSSIQKVFRTNADLLTKKDTHYLGMWFDIINPDYRGYEGQQKFFEASAEEMESLAGDFLNALTALSKEQGTQTFILSNEALFGHIRRFGPFLDALKTKTDVQVIAYMRDPHSWLSSAYTQWGIRHKHHTGPVQPFGTRARDLINQYEGIRGWIKGFSDILTIRPFEKGLNVVEDFAQAIDLEIDLGEKRYLERAEPAEILLRALFNTRFEAPVRPERFDRMILNTNKKAIPKVKDMVDMCLRHDGVEEIIAEKQELFEFIRDNTGMDFLNGTTVTPKMPDMTELESRLVDYLLEITFDQAQRLKRLELQLENLQKTGDT